MEVLKAAKSDGSAKLASAPLREDNPKFGRFKPSLWRLLRMRRRGTSSVVSSSMRN